MRVKFLKKYKLFKKRLSKPSSLWYKRLGDAFSPNRLYIFYGKCGENMQQQILSDRYEVTGLLGAGASGRVYLARHRVLGQDRAIKCIPKSVSDHSGFPSEAGLLKSLNHPAIPIIYDFEEDDENYYLIEEYVAGESLEAYVLHQTTIPLDFVLRIGRQLCDVIGYLHARPTPIIYQDLKPEHIIVYGNQLKIVDFGIASYISNEGNPYQSYGTAAFAAPEKRLGLPCDERTDIYGIGRILQFLEQYIPKEVPRARLNGIIYRATAPELSQRFSGTSHLMEELESYASGISEGKEHLITNLAVIGMKPGIGATHLAVSYHVYLNGAGIPSLYTEKNDSGDLRRIARRSWVRKENKTVSCGDFCAVLSRSKEQEWLQRAEGCLVQDFGTYESTDIELEQCDGMMLVLGGRDWEIEPALALYERLYLRKHLVPVVNYGNERMAKYYARRWRRNVYCFPLDKDPAVPSMEKKRFFDTLRKKEGW